MTTRPGVKTLQKSSIRGVHITQFVDKIPKGCSTPDFERKPVSLTLQEGKNAIFRAVVKGVPAPEVKWKRAKGEINDPAKYLTFYSPATSEHILQINKITAGDSDLYRCFAVNEYGEASCSAGLRIIQVGFKRKANYVTGHPAEELKKSLQDLKKTLKKRAPLPKQKVLDKDAVFQLLLHADKKDYERICIKYGISDFRGMLRALQDLRKDTENEQAKLIHSIKYMEHIKVNKDGSASFTVEMDLKSASSNIYLLKDGEKVRYGTGDEYRKYYLRQIGKRYHFIVNDVHPEDAGLYQVKVEDVPIFSTELDAESIPVRFQKPLSDLHCHEDEDVVFDCVLRTPCFDAVWLHKAHPLEASEKHQISVSPDGLNHQLIIRNAVTTDSGLYTLDTGLCSSRAWLLVEHAREAKIQDEEHEKSDHQKGTPDKDRAKRLKHGEYVGDEDHPMDAGMKRGGWHRSDHGGGQGYSPDADGEYKFLGKEGLHKIGDEIVGPGQFAREEDTGLKFGEDKVGLRHVHSQGSMSGRGDTDDGLGGGTKSHSVDGRHDSMLGAADVDMGDAEGANSWHDKNAKLGDASSGAAFGGMKTLDATDGSSVSGGINLGSARVGGAHSVYSKDGLPAAVDMNAVSINREGEIGSPYSKGNLLVDAGGHVGQAGMSGLLYGAGGVPAGDGGRPGAGGSFVGEMEVLYGPDGLPVGAGVDAKRGDLYGKHGQSSEPYGKDGLPAGMEAGLGGAGLEGAGSMYGKGGAGVAGAGQFGPLYGKDGLQAGAVIGGTGAGGVGSPFGKDGLPAGAGAGVGVAGLAGVGVAGLAGAGAAGSPYGRDGLPAGAGVSIAGVRDAGSSYGKDGLSAAAGSGAAHFPSGGEEVMGSHHGQDAMLGRAQGSLGGAGGAALSSEGGGVGGSAIRGAGSAHGSAGSRAGESSASRLGGDGSELYSVHGKEGVVGAVGKAGEYGLDSRAGKSPYGEAGKGTASDLRGSEHKGSSHDRESLSSQGDARAEARDLGQSGSPYDRDSSFGGAEGKFHDKLFSGWKPGILSQSSQGSDQMSALHGGPSVSQRKQGPSLDIKAGDFLKSTESTENRRRHHLDDLKAPRSRVNKQLADVRVLKGEPTELSCAVNRHDLTGTWFKDGLKLTSMEGVTLEKEGLVHKLIISKVEDIHAGKYRFEAGDIKTEASIFVEDPPQVNEFLLKNLMSVPTVAKAGEKVVIKIPFEGRLPVRAMWLKDKIELGDDSRIRVDKTDTFTMLSISNAERKDCGDYKVRLKNDSGILDIDLKVEVIDKPQRPAGPLKIVESSANDVTIQWNPPKDDGGKPVQNYVIEKQQVGKSDWVTLGETPRSCTTFTTSKVEQDMSYYFRVRAVNAEGSSDALESNEVVTISKATPGAPDPPEIVGVSKDTITISWKAPRKTGSSRISGYIVQKRKMGSMTWVPVNSVPIADKKLKVTDLKKGLQYEFCVAAVNASGMGDISAPSQPAFARDSTKPPGKVRDLKMTISDSSSVTLTWNVPEAEEGSGAKGYDVEMRSANSLSWTKCNIFPIETTTYKIKGLQTKETYFLRVRAINDCGPGEATELEAFTEVVRPVVFPRFIIDKTVKNFLLIKAGNAIRVNIPFEAPPDSVLTWLKDGASLPSRAKISTQDGTSQLLIKAAEFTDSGIYTVELTSGTGKRETFSFRVQVTDIPQPPGPIELRENVPNIVTVTWEPSTSEKWESNLYYTVMKRESQKGVWHVVGDLIYTNKFTYTSVIPGRDYYFRVVAKNYLGSSRPSDTAQPWRVRKQKADIQVRPQRYKGVNQNQPPRFLVPLKPHVVIAGTECRMSCAVGGHPPPKITWYKDGRDLSNNPSYFGTNNFGVCSLVIFGASKADEGDYMVEATNDLGRAFSKASLIVKDSCL
ncbi:immunoglobulin-like and fibronectin type III domain-containing protein 1 isoform X9 [Lagopus leucura]|uniref:immunoglobulin-like and fibronectin type III domain-containing protein 1 isoform X9 n=1 Tax=Lagopus leucura TaxID=30410 RepID=UPI001C671AF0|nr:immunoglobulin-like and fibronectin type III domain-containing protein 1 isoform X9 [Lagopus leucura]